MRSCPDTDIDPAFLFKGNAKTRKMRFRCETLCSETKTHQMFSVHTTPEKFINATITGHFGFVFKENSGRELSCSHRLRKAPFFKLFSVHTKTQSRRIQIPPV